MSDKTRNFAFISHGGAGKTVLTEMCLLNAGIIDNPGNIDAGNTHSDFTPEEKEHKYSITNSYFNFPWGENKINLIDTPGYADFKGEVTSALRIVEGAVLLIDGTAGIEVNTNYVWKMAEENEVSRFIFVNKMDKEGADFSEVYSELKENLSGNLVPLTIPYKEDKEYKGVINLLTNKFINKEQKKSEIPEEALDFTAEYRMELMEAIVERDDELMMKYLEEEEITDQELQKVLLQGVKNKELVPLMSGAALENSGVNVMLDNLVKLVPNAEYYNTIIGEYDGEEVELKTNEDSPFVGLIAKTMVDPYIGKLSIFRLYSGKLDTSCEIYVPRLDTTLKTSKLYKLNGSKQETVDELVAGDIGAVAKMDELETSDTISSSDLKIELKKIEFPVPMLTKAVLPVSEGDEEKLSSSLQRISLSDPTFLVDYNKETKEQLVTAMGTVHLSVIKDLCQRKFDVTFNTVDPKVAYRETIRRKTQVEEKYKKQSGGRGQYGHVLIRLEPLPRGKGFEFDEEIFGGAIPNQYIPAVEKGIREAMGEGILAGYPVVDFKAVVYDGSYHSVDSSEMAFKIAASKAFKNGLKDAKSVLLEPIMEIEVIVPEEFMGDIMGDLNSRRGKIMGMNPGDGVQRIKAQVPEGEMFNYSSDLKSITGGHGRFTMEFSHYDKVPSDISEKIIEESKQEEE